MRNIYALVFTLFAGLLMGLGSINAQSGNNCANAIPLDVNINQCVLSNQTFVGATTSSQIPSGCSEYEGGDLWFSAVLPLSGEVTVRAQLNTEAPVDFSMDPNMAAYSGSCGSLVQLGCDEDSGPGFYPEITVSGTPGNTVYFQLWDAENDVQSDFDICANGTPQCTSPIASFDEVCDGNNQYSVEVNITNFGSASELNITNDGGAAAINGITSTGVQTVGPFDLGDAVNITVEHVDDSSCNLSYSATDVGSTCENVLACGSSLNQTYCYGNNDNTAFLYSSPDNSNIELVFNSGLIQAGADEITIRDGDNASAPVLFDGDNGGDLSGLSVTATSGSLYLQVTTDVGGSCQEGSLGLGGGWDWDVTCLGVPECDSAPVIASETTFAESQISADLAAAVFSGADQCVGSGNPDLYFTFEAVGSVQYIRVQGDASFDPVVEFLGDGCGTDATECVNEAGAGDRELFWVTDLTIGQEYTFKVYHNSASGALSNTSIEVAVAHIPTTRLRPRDCGSSGLETTDIIRSLLPSPSFLLNAFEFEFTELEAPFETYTVVSPNGSNPQFILQWFPEIEFGRSYSVRVRCQMYQGPNWGEFGPACTIELAGEPESGLRSVYNGGTFSTCDVVKAIPVGQATNYRWVFDSGLETYEVNTSNTVLQLANADLPVLTTFDVEVFATVNGEEGSTSLPGSLSLAGVPNTALNPSFLGCGSVVNAGAWTQAQNVCGADSYTFRFTNVDDPQDTFTDVRPTRVLVTNSPNIMAGATYDVDVFATINGTDGDYAGTCQLTFMDDSEDGLTGIVQQPEFSIASPNAALTVYPNPSVEGDEITVVISEMEAKTQNVEIEVYDMMGKRLVHERYSNSASVFNQNIVASGQLATGVYILQTRIDGVVTDTEKLIID
ncbi:MAG: T9SS type A sorting domain-containing protein [Cryomorphaceae bacterium]|nr:T9SS type A sorting domain-containing protein [Flavobacteriales bacterium]